MRPIVRSLVALVLTGCTAFVLGGCATLAVTPLQTPKPTAVSRPVNLGIQAFGERLRDALSDPTDSVVATTSGKLFDKVVLLPPEARLASPAQVRSTYGADYLLTTNISDVTVDGKLNPIWFATIPILFFKPLAPIVTFEATVTLDATIRDTASGAVLVQRQVSESSTDHYSPIDPQEKVQKLIGRSINNALLTLLEEFQAKLPTRQAAAE